MNAIIIDDSKTMRAILSKMVRELGIDQALQAEDGADALDRLGECDPPPGLALVDWNMPGMDGLSFVRALRSDARYAGVKVLMVTTETELARVTEALEAGADEYMMKPFTPEALADKLRLLGFDVGPSGGNVQA